VTIPAYLAAEQDKIRVEYTERDRDFVPATLQHLSSAIKQLADYFDLPASFPTVRAIIVPNRPEFDRCVKEILKIEIEVPSDPCRIAQPQRTDLILLSPNAYGQSTTTYTPDGYERLITHETVHIVEECLSPDMEKTPRWWSEGLAMFLSRQWIEGEGERVVQEVAAGRIPAIADMQQGPAASEGVKLCYVWGWTIVMYIDEAYGKSMIKRIVRECDDGNVFAVLDEDPHELEAKWKDWLREAAATGAFRIE
jgi:hypothetical protein